MGARIEFSCPACGLSGRVSGGNDCGFETATTTIYCESCDNLQDVPTVLKLRLANERKVEPRCTKGESHPVRRWNLHEPCPRCGKAKLEFPAGRPSVLWD